MYPPTGHKSSAVNSHCETASARSHAVSQQSKDRFSRAAVARNAERISNLIFQFTMRWKPSRARFSFNPQRILFRQFVFPSLGQRGSMRRAFYSAGSEHFGRPGTSSWHARTDSDPMTTNRIGFRVLLFVLACCSSGRLVAQEAAQPATPETQPAAAQPAIPEGTPAAAPQAVPLPGRPGRPAPGPNGKVPGGPEQPGAKPGEGVKPETPGAKPEAPKTNARPTKPLVPANPEELKVRPDDDGRVRFNFQGQ